MSLVEGDRKPSKPDLAFLKGMRTVREKLGKLNPEELSGLPLEDRARKVMGVLETARRDYFERSWIDNARLLEPVISSLGRGEITPEDILQAVSGKKEDNQPQPKPIRPTRVK